MYLALDAARRGGTYPSVLAGADEEAVRLFLNGVLPFSRIADVVEDVLSRHQPVPAPPLEAVLEADQWARLTCRELAARLAA
jgi:1-deoxy-D-xylulose-5-phosphate reductoisomerase